MAERIYNIFLFFENDVCSAVGYKAHEYLESDAKSSEYLKAHVAEDLPGALRLKLAKPFTRSEYNARCRLGEGHYLYDELFAALDAGPAPLFVTTPIKNGEIFFNYSSGHGDLDINDISAKVGGKSNMVDWLGNPPGQ